MRIKKLYGGPGTGKTTRMLDMVRAEIAGGVKITEIAFLSHTNAAADEAYDRIAGELSGKRPRFFCTLHAAASRALALGATRVWSEGNNQELSNLTNLFFSKEQPYNPEMGIEDGRPYLQCISYASSMMVPIEEAFEAFSRYEINFGTLCSVIKIRGEMKKKYNLCDYDDQLRLYLERPVPLNIKVMFVDEAQDLSKLQWSVVAELWKDCDRVYICGDDDQSVYEFMGANTNSFLHHPCDEEETLQISWRVPRVIGGYADRIISRVRDRKIKNIRWREDDGSIDRVGHDLTDVKIDPKESTFVLTQHQSMCRDAYEIIASRNIPVDFGKKGCFSHDIIGPWRVFRDLRDGKEVSRRMVIYMLKAVEGKENSVSKLERCIGTDQYKTLNKSHVGLAWKGSWWFQFGRHHEQQQRFAELGEIMKKHGEEVADTIPEVRVKTFHGSKGLEADHVILIPNIFPAAWDSQEEGMNDSQTRLAYVAATRARHRLTILEPSGKMYCRAMVETR